MKLEPIFKSGSRARLVRAMMDTFWAILQVYKFCSTDPIRADKVLLVHEAVREGPFGLVKKSQPVFLVNLLVTSELSCDRGG